MSLLKLCQHIVHFILGCSEFSYRFIICLCILYIRKRIPYAYLFAFFQQILLTSRKKSRPWWMFQELVCLLLIPKCLYFLFWLSLLFLYCISLLPCVWYILTSVTTYHGMFLCAHPLLTISRKVLLPVYFVHHPNEFEFQQLINIKSKSILVDLSKFIQTALSLFW